MNFDFQSIQLTALYGYFKDLSGQNVRHVQLPVDMGVQRELNEMSLRTAKKLGLPGPTHQMEVYNPAQKYGKEEKLKLSLTTSYVQELALVVALRNLPSDAAALNAAADLNYYYAIFVDTNGKKLYGFRRGSQFKGVIKSKLAVVNGGILTLISSSVFRLDHEFDYFVLDNEIFILRPSGFEYTTNVQLQILRSASANANTIASALTYLDVASISAYATTHIRSARLLAAIGGRSNLNQVNKTLLLQACSSFSIPIIIAPNGMISPSLGSEYDFLCILDRRAYTSTLIPNQPEKYEAANRIQR